MKKLMFAVFAMALSSALWADSYAFTYQAALRDEKGNVLDSRNHAVTIRLWDAPIGGSRLWSRSFNVMTDANGLFNLAVSDGGSQVPGEETESTATLESVFVSRDAGDVYIGLEVQNSAGEIVPRQRLFAVPFAAVANDVRKISQDVVVGGNIKMGGAEDPNVLVTKEGISQKNGESKFHDIVLDGTLSAGGHITATKGLTVNGGTLSVKTNIEIDSGKSLKIGDAEIVPVPLYGIIMWTQPDLPNDDHWAVCDGQTVTYKVDGKTVSVTTPDLRDRFVVGAGNTYNVRDTGGEARHKLTISEMPSHNHTYNFSTGDIDDSWKNSRYFFDYSNHYNTNQQKSTNYTGGDQPHENRPPYYAVYYIMRVK